MPSVQFQGRHGQPVQIAAFEDAHMPQCTSLEGCYPLAVVLTFSRKARNSSETPAVHGMRNFVGLEKRKLFYPNKAYKAVLSRRFLLGGMSQEPEAGGNMEIGGNMEMCRYVLPKPSWNAGCIKISSWTTIKHIKV
jgi:hypothetical protein